MRRVLFSEVQLFLFSLSLDLLRQLAPSRANPSSQTHTPSLHTLLSSSEHGGSHAAYVKKKWVTWHTGLTEMSHMTITWHTRLTEINDTGIYKGLKGVEWHSNSTQTQNAEGKKRRNKEKGRRKRRNETRNRRNTHWVQALLKVMAWWNCLYKSCQHCTAIVHPTRVNNNKTTNNTTKTFSLSLGFILTPKPLEGISLQTIKSVMYVPGRNRCRYPWRRNYRRRRRRRCPCHSW